MRLKQHIGIKISSKNNHHKLLTLFAIEVGVEVVFVELSLVVFRFNVDLSVDIGDIVVVDVDKVVDVVDVVDVDVVDEEGEEGEEGEGGEGGEGGE